MKFLKILFIIFIFQSKAYALIEVDITRGNLSPLPVAVSSLSSDKKTSTKIKEIDLIVELIGGAEGPAKKLVFTALKNNWVIEQLESATVSRRPCLIQKYVTAIHSNTCCACLWCDGIGQGQPNLYGPLLRSPRVYEIPYLLVYLTSAF